LDEVFGSPPKVLRQRFHSGRRGKRPHPGEDALDVAIDDRYWLIECDGTDGSGRVRTHTWKGLPFIRGDRPCSGEFFQDQASCLLESAGARVVAKAGPELEEAIEWSVGNRLQVRQRGHPAQVVGNDGGDLGLLQHGF
jgi:hypothetical protein